MSTDDIPIDGHQSETEKHRTSIQHTEAHGRRSGVGNPLTFAPLSDLFDTTTHFLRSNDILPKTSTFVSIDSMERVIESVQEFGKLGNSAGWWGMDQSQAEWHGTGLARFREQLWVPHAAHPYVESPHHSGTAVWIAPVGEIVSGVEAVIVAGDPSSHPGEGTTLGESVRRPCVSLLLSDGHKTALREADANIEMPFFEEQGEPDSGMKGMARYEEWSTNRGAITESVLKKQHSLSVRYLEATEGPHGPELQITNPYYRDPAQALSDLSFNSTGRGTTPRNLLDLAPI